MSPARVLVVAALATACHGALAQSAIPPTSVVQQLAPQLVAFSGSDANFQSLVNGLAQGTTVQLSSTLPNGFLQTVTFTPAAPMAPAQIAQVLESARQQLIGLGIATPTAEQLGFTLMGGVVPTALGGTQVAGVLNPGVNPASPPSPAAQLQGQLAGGIAAGGSTSATPIPGITNRVSVTLTPGPAPATTSAGAPGAPRQTSDSSIPAGGTSRSPAALTSATPLPSAPLAPGAAAAATPGQERATQNPSPVSSRR